MLPDGKIESIYCHWDGYPSHNGKLLLENYQTPEKIEALIALGNLSSLAPEIGEKKPFEAPDCSVSPEAYKAHYATVTAYHRDRGEDWNRVKPSIHDDLAQLSEYASEYWAEYVYLWDGTTWKFSKCYKTSRISLRPLTAEQVSE